MRAVEFLSEPYVYRDEDAVVNGQQDDEEVPVDSEFRIVLYYVPGDPFFLLLLHHRETLLLSLEDKQFSEYFIIIFSWN